MTAIGHGTGRAAGPGAPTVAIVGGGLLGLAAAHRLLDDGVQVAVYESDRRLGGLAASVDLEGYPVDRYYHVVLPTDHRVRELAAEVGIGEDRFRFRQTAAGFWNDGRFSSMSSARELLTFPGLSPLERARFGAFVARCQLRSQAGELERTSLEQWLRAGYGEGLWRKLFAPLLDSKFDGEFDDVPATYLWARTRRMSGTRDKAAREVMGTIDGGYQVLVDALAERIRARGGEIHTSTPVRSIAYAQGRVLGVVTDGGLRAADWVVTTQLRPGIERFLPRELSTALGPDPCRYLGVVCLVARVRRSISPYYALNITDRSVPLTTVVETTHVVDPARSGGHLLYIPRYVTPDSPDLQRDADELTAEYLGHVRRMFPALDPSDVIATHLARARAVEPVHVLGGRRPCEGDLFPVPGLATASSAHVYPELVNGQAVLGVAERLVDGLLRRISRATGPDRIAA